MAWTKQAANPADVFRRFGLGAPGLLGAIAVPQRESGSGFAQKLKTAFEQLGGLYPAFAEFLLWRADLLGLDYLNALREIRFEVPPVPQETVEALLRRELGPKGYDLAHRMKKGPVWSTLSRTAYLSSYQGAKVVVQVASELIPEADLHEFERGIRYLGHPELAQLAEPRTIAEFRKWLRQAESCVTERAYLEILGKHRHKTLADYPALIPELTTDIVLCWPWVEGEPVSALVRSGRTEAITQVAAAVLEQYCNLSIVNADLPGDAMVMRSDGNRLAVRRVNRPITVPATLVNTGMKYVAAVLEGNTSVMVQALATMTLGKAAGRLDVDLRESLSAVEPELKVGLWFPEGAASFESNWRALARLDVERPLFLNCLHRNLLATGYWTAEAVAAGGAPIDTIAEAHWPVVQRVVKANSARFLDPLVAAEWSIGMGLLSFGAMREANRLVEEVRDNNLTMEVDFGVARKPAQKPGRRNLRAGVLIACLLAVLLATLRWGTGHQAVAAFIAVIALAALFRAVGKLS